MILILHTSTVNLFWNMCLFQHMQQLYIIWLFLALAGVTYSCFSIVHHHKADRSDRPPGTRQKPLVSGRSWPENPIISPWQRHKHHRMNTRGTFQSSAQSHQITNAFFSSAGFIHMFLPCGRKQRRIKFISIIMKSWWACMILALRNVPWWTLGWSWWREFIACFIIMNTYSTHGFWERVK